MGGLCFYYYLYFFKNLPILYKMSERRFSLAGIAFDIPAASFT